MTVSFGFPVYITVETPAPSTSSSSLTAIVTRDEPAWSIDTGEIEAGIPVPTIQTLERIKAQIKPAELFLIIGGDQAHQFNLWQSPDEIFNIAKVICFTRDSHSIAPKYSERMLQVPYQSDVSSSIIREVINTGGKDLLIDPDIADYIRKNQLYK